jgi:hypothetical protein
VYSIGQIKPKKGGFVFYGNKIEKVLYVDNDNDIVITDNHLDGISTKRCDAIIATNNPYLIENKVVEIIPGLDEKFIKLKDEIVSGTWSYKAKQICCNQLMSVDPPEFIYCEKCNSRKGNLMHGIQNSDVYLDVDIINK